MDTDSALVARLLDRDPTALGEVYSRYADRLFTYAVGQMGGDRDRAGDAVSDAFLLAYDRIGQLRDPERLRPWLYAIVRSECLRRHRSAARTVAWGEGHDVIDTSAAVDRDLERSEARELVAATLETLNDPDREVLELALRHDLDSTAVASVLGLSATHVGARLSRARKQLEKALLSAMFVRTEGRDCARLREILDAGEAGSKLLRKRVTRHIDSCAACERRKPGMVAAIPSLGVLPMVAAPESLRQAVLGTTGTTPGPGPEGSAHTDPLAEVGRTGEPGSATPGSAEPGSTDLTPGGGPKAAGTLFAADLARRAAEVSRARPSFGSDGFPVVAAAANRNRVIAVAAAVLAVILAGVVWWATASDEVTQATEPTVTPGAAADTGTIPAAPASPESTPAPKDSKAASKGGGTAGGTTLAEPAPAAPANAAAQGGAALPLSGDSGAPAAPPAAPTKPVKTPKPDPSPTPTATKSPKPSPSPTTTPKPTPSPSPTGSGGPTVTPTPTPTASPAPLPTLSWTFTDLAAGTCPAVFSGSVTATVSGGDVAQATAVWTDTTTSESGQKQLTKSGNTFTGTVTGIPTQTTVLMTVEAVTDDGRPLAEEVRDVSHICPG